MLAAISTVFPDLTSGRLIGSGSGKGFHIPVFVDQLPDFGWNSKQERPKGIKTWLSDLGRVEVRARFHQAIVPPSIHSSGNPYIFVQPRKIVKVNNLDNLIDWLNQIAPPKQKAKPKIPVANGHTGLETVRFLMKSRRPGLRSMFSNIGD